MFMPIETHFEIISFNTEVKGTFYDQVIYSSMTTEGSICLYSNHVTYIALIPPNNIVYHSN